MIIQNVYDNYHIPERLQLHMLRVAGVAKIIADTPSYSGSIDDLVRVCLLHDLGNIVKIPFEEMTEIQPRMNTKYSLEQRRQIKSKIKGEYGNDAGEATINMVNALPVAQSIKDIMPVICMTSAINFALHDDINAKICRYSDMIVAPQGITSLENRLREAYKRYGEDFWKDEKHFSNILTNAMLLESQVIQHTGIAPEIITEEALSPNIEELRNFTISS